MDNRLPRSRGTPLVPQPPPQPPQIHQQEPSQSRPPRGPVRIYTVTPKIVHVDPDNFMTLVQRLTGQTSTSAASSSSSTSTSSAALDASCGLISPAVRLASTENANTSNELGTFVGGVGTMDQYYNHHHQHHPIERPSFHHAGILSPGSTFLPWISPDFFSTVGPTETQDGYWNQQRQYQPSMSSTHHGGHLKRPCSDFECPPSAMPSGHDRHSYLSRDEGRGIPHSVKDTRTIGSAYDRYLQSVQTPSMPSEEADPFNGVGMGRPGGNNMMPGPPMGELMGGRGGLLPPDIRPNGRAMGFGHPDSVGRPSRELLPLTPYVSSTLYVEGLPSNCSRRKVSDIFRPFVGYREVRLVTNDLKHRNGDPIVLRFVDFENPACAATALSALQGYRMDDKILRLQFSRNPGPRPGQRGGRR